MSDVVSAYKEYHKSDLILAYKEFLRQNKRWRKRKDGYNHKGNGLERPTINGVIHSWKAFSRLPKDIVIVHTYMEGCDAKFLGKLTKGNFFKKKKKLATPWVHDNMDYKSWLWKKDRARAIKFHPYYWGYTRYGDGDLVKTGVGQGQFNSIHAQRRERELDWYNPHRLYGPDFRTWLENKDTDWREEE